MISPLSSWKSTQLLTAYSMPVCTIPLYILLNEATGRGPRLHLSFSMTFAKCSTIERFDCMIPLSLFEPQI